MNSKKTIISMSIALLLLVVIAGVLLVKLIRIKKEGYPATETTQYAADAEPTQADGTTGENAENRTEEPESNSVPAITTAAPVPEGEQNGELTFASLPEHYMFLSGAGAWRTNLWLKDDGSFHGEYFDSDMGVHQYYFCNFDGQFAAPVRLNEYSWSLKIETMETNHELNGGVADEQAEYIESEPYGIANTQELILYLPKTSLTLLPEECIPWLHLHEGDTEIPADRYVLYNATEGYAFISVQD